MQIGGKLSPALVFHRRMHSAPQIAARRERFARLNDIAHELASNAIYDYLPGRMAIQQHFPRWLR